jgi:DNA-binding response OmpR family regulator
VADDEELVIGTTRQILKCLGYRVIVAHTGEETLETLRGDAVALVLLDPCISVSGGDPILHCLHAEFPAVPVILTGVDPAKLEEVSYAAGTLGKPFRIRTLAAEIRRILDQSAGPE